MGCNRGVSAARAAPKRSVTTMMPIGVPRVPYKTPGENSWQWVDIWNCLYRERIVFVGGPVREQRQPNPRRNPTRLWDVG